jgi:hypothetical protein
MPKSIPIKYRFAHCEPIQQILGTNNFTNLDTLIGATAAHTWAINPGNSVVFPWLSNLAINFEFYKVRKLRFKF